MKKITFNLLALLFSILTLAQTEDLIKNGNFHNCTDWAITGDFTYDCGNPDSIYQQFNDSYGYAYSFQQDNSSGGIGQNINFLENLTSIKLKFHYKISTSEINNDIAHDSLKIILARSPTDFYEVGILSNKDKSTNYKEKEYDIPTDLFKGETILLSFIFKNDGAKPTRFRIDDVSLLVTKGSSNTGNNELNFGIESPSVSNPSPSVGGEITLKATQFVSKESSDGNSYTPRPYLGFSYSTKLNDLDNLIYIGKKSSTIGKEDDLDEEEEQNFTIPEELEGKTIYIYYIPDYEEKYAETDENDYKTVKVTVKNITTPTSGNISVTLSPDEIENNGRWRYSSNTNWLASGEVVSLPFGNYKLEFSEVQGYTKPNNKDISISASTPNYNDTFTYTSTANTNKSVISGTYSNPTINDNFQIIDGSLNNTKVSLYKNGQLVSQNIEKNGTFSFTNLSNGTYRLAAEYYINGAIEFQTEKIISITSNVNISEDLVLSQGLINKIYTYNDNLKNLTCYWRFTNKTYKLYDNGYLNSYDVSAIDSFDIGYSYIDKNYDYIIDRLARIAIFSKVTNNFYSKACELSIAYLEHNKNLIGVPFDLIKSITCKMNRNNPTLFQQWILGGQKEVVKLIKDHVLRNEDNETQAMLGLIMDSMIINFFGGNEPSDTADVVLDFVKFYQIQSFGQNSINRFLSKGYVNKTGLQFQTSLSNLIKSNQNKTLSDLSKEVNTKYSDLKVFVDDKVSKSNNYIITPKWLETVEIVNSSVNNIVCNKYTLTFDVVFKSIDLVAANAGIYQTVKARNEYYPKVNNTLISLYGAKSQIKTNNCSSKYFEDTILKYHQLVDDFNNNLYSSEVNLNQLDSFMDKHNELVKYERILETLFSELKSNSILEDLEFDNYLSNFKNKSFHYRTTLLMLYNFYKNDQVNFYKNEILNNVELVKRNVANSKDILSILSRSLNSFCVPAKLLITKNDNPMVVTPLSQNEFDFEITNVGTQMKEKLIITIDSDENIFFPQSVFEIEPLLEGESKIIRLKVFSIFEPNVSNYQISISSTEFEDPVISLNSIATVRDKILSVNDTFDGNENFLVSPNPVLDILEIKNTNKLEIKKIQIFNVLGKNVFDNYQGLKTINVSNFSPGVYFIKISSERGAETVKFIKE